jgi:hypothetical protein
MITLASYHRRTVYGQERGSVRALRPSDICDRTVTVRIVRDNL